ncbi:MAG TPA: LytTR family DNA-binding domain-containing protein [Roseivirga sp.]
MNTQNINFVLSSRYKWTLSISISIFFYLFMLVFLPFGITNYDPHFEYNLEFLFTLSLFSLATLTTVLFNEFILRKSLIKVMSLFKLIIWSVWLVLITGTVNFLIYNLLGEWHDFKITSAIDFITNLAAVLIFPIAGTFTYFRFQNLKTHYEEILNIHASSIQTDQLISLQGEGNNEHIKIALKDFLYAQAQDNYVEIVYLSEKSVQKFLLRSSISKMINQVNDPLIIRCHRSYIINLFNVRSTIGNHHLQLNLNHIQYPIPVSKTYLEVVAQKIKTYRASN